MCGQPLERRTTKVGFADRDLSVQTALPLACLSEKTGRVWEKAHVAARLKQSRVEVRKWFIEIFCRCFRQPGLGRCSQK